MRIEPTSSGRSVRHREQRTRDLRGLLTILANPTRPCPNCDRPDHELSGRCGWGCPDAPAMLSSEPTRFPIEFGIIPLVYELSLSGVYEPCWSCEGHLDASGRMTRVPQAWFTTPSASRAELVAAHLADLRASGSISNAWRVTLCPISDAGATTFMILPDTPPEPGKAELISLQADAMAIAQGFRDGVKAIANESLRRS